MNQYNKRLVFSTVDDNVPSRGITADRTARADQLVAALDYEQTIEQIAAADMPSSGDAGPVGLPIHHEPGLFLHMKQQRVDGFDIARLATIPHGNAANAVGRSVVIDGPPTIGDLSGLPEGVTTDIAAAVHAADDAQSRRPLDRYLFPYHHFTVHPFEGLLSPADTNALLQSGLPSDVVRTTILDLSTELDQAGIVNIPFIERQADASQMRSTFWSWNSPTDPGTTNLAS